ncbi:hypothetical protein [Burkholderia seminalis]|uniref:hypothetical protein n=1 Tax=Burkholderia seminalis TaxID=488731 RepID=UPI00158AF95E|nr:hypothetical protein [Burkholderia seminalis]
MIRSRKMVLVLTLQKFALRHDHRTARPRDLHPLPGTADASRTVAVVPLRRSRALVKVRPTSAHVDGLKRPQSVRFAVGSVAACTFAIPDVQGNSDARLHARR